MPFLSEIIRGQPFTAETFFQDSSGNPLPSSLTPAFCSIRDPNGNLIFQINPTQDFTDPRRWFIICTIPSGAPAGVDIGKYSIQWTLGTYTNTEYFVVLAEINISTDSTDVIMLENTIFTDNLIVDHQISGPITIQVFDDYKLLFDSGPQTITPIQLNGRYVYQYSSPAPIIGIFSSHYDQNSYSIRWNYNNVLGPNIDIHALYVLNNKTILFLNTMKHTLDKARNYDINPSLRFTDAELFNFLINGLQRINGSPPQFTNFNFVTIPRIFYSTLVKAGELEALQAWRLAEGLAAFEFSGQSTQLSIDRTQHIELLISELSQYLDIEIERQKRLLARSVANRNAGSVGISIGPKTNYPRRFSPNGDLLPR